MKNKFLSSIKDDGFKINLTLFLVILAISIIQLNRAFTIGSLSAIVFLLFFYNKVRLGKIQILIALLIISLLTVSTTLFVKSDSTLGRLFIYKISWGIVKENYLYGIGLGNFQVKYGLYQAKYFEGGFFTKKEFLLADNVFYAFNDYWQFICETGLIGVAIIIISIYYLLKIIVRRIEQQSKSAILALSISALIVICVAALFTHVLEKKIFQLILISILSYLIIYTSAIKIKDNIKLGLFILFPFVVLILQTHNYLINISSYNKFEKAKELWSVGYFFESNKIAKEIYPSLKNDVEFFIFYSDSFFSKKNYQNRLDAYNLLLTKRTDYRLYIEQGRNYENLLLFKEAELAYLTAMFMVPNRFQTRNVLFDFYMRIKELKKAKSLAIFTLKMPVKIASPRVEEIKMKFAKKINNIN